MIVPVLSEQMHETRPMFSTATARRTSACRLAQPIDADAEEEREHDRELLRAAPPPPASPRSRSASSQPWPCAAARTARISADEHRRHEQHRDEIGDRACSGVRPARRAVAERTISPYSVSPPV